MTEEQASLLELLREMRAERAARAKLASPEAGGRRHKLRCGAGALRPEIRLGLGARGAGRSFFGDPQGFERADR
jgi:hypothetical protein